MKKGIKRAKYLIYHHFVLSDSSYEFYFEIDDRPVIMRVSQSKKSNLSQNIQERILKQIGLVFLIDLAEVTIPEKIIIDIPFSYEELAFWKDAYWEIARERMYVDQLDLSLLDVPWELTQPQAAPTAFALQNEKKHGCFIIYRWQGINCRSVPFEEASGSSPDFT